MRILNALLIGLTFLLASCSSNSVLSRTCESELDYHNFESQFVKWNQVLSLDKNQYFVYIFMVNCGHCNEIKQNVLCYASNHTDFYFCEYSKEILVIEDINETIGKGDIEEIGIKGTPTLLGIENGVLVMNIAGSKAIIETLTNLP